MKKISLLIAFIFCAIVSYGQFPNDQYISNAKTIYHAKGALKGDSSFMLPIKDTLNNPATPYFGAVTVLPSDVGLASIPIWMSNGIYWIRYNGGTGTNINDTIWTRLPIFVDYTSDPPKRILTLLHPDGIVTPGYVIWTGIGLNFIVTPAFYYIGYRAINSPATSVTLAPAPVSGTRSDLFIVDTLATASALTGAAGGVVPQTNPSSQLPLTSVPVNAGDTIPANIQLETVYDEHLAPPAEWTPTTTGTNTVDFDNTDFPYWGTKAAFASTYTNGSALVFTKSGTPDTVTAGAILRGFISFNIPFTGQLQFQWYNGSTATSNSIAVSSGYGINPNNVNTYQIFAIPLNAFTFLPSSNNLFNKLVITFAGSDISGAGGLYLDRLQLQTGLLNVDQPPPPAWYLKGNAGTSAGSDFLGTTDNEPLMFKVNGVQAGLIGTTATFNTSLGIISLPKTSTGIKNTAIGGGALGLNTTGFNNTGLGYTTNYHNLIGNNNTAVGWAAIGWNRGDGNTAVGYSALNSTVSVVRDARHNTAIGFEALQNNGDHKFNIGLGIQAGQLSTTILGGIARDSTLYISNFTKNMYFRLDSAAGTAPSVIGKDTSGFWHVYQNSGSGGVSALAAIGSTPNANGATIVGTVLNLEPASVSFGGVVTNGTQTLGGYKTFAKGIGISDVSGSTHDIYIDGQVTSAVIGSYGEVAPSSGDANGYGLQLNTIFTASADQTFYGVDIAGVPNFGANTADYVALRTNAMVAIQAFQTADPTLTLDATASAYIFTGTTTTWTLPSVSTRIGWVYELKNRGSGAITLNADGGNNEIYTTSAVNTLTINAGSSATLISDGDYFNVQNGSSGGGGNTIYTADDAITTNRTVDLNGKILDFNEDGNSLIYINPVSFNTAINASDNTANTGLQMYADGVGNNVAFVFNSTDGVNNVEILGNPITNTITHTAATNIFDGVLRIKGYTVATLPAGVQGDLAFVTDALAPAYHVTVAGSGAVVTPVFFDGTNWIVD